MPDIPSPNAFDGYFEGVTLSTERYIYHAFDTDEYYNVPENLRNKEFNSFRDAERHIDNISIHVSEDYFAIVIVIVHLSNNYDYPFKVIVTKDGVMEGSIKEKMQEIYEESLSYYGGAKFPEDYADRVSWFFNRLLAQN